jgi:hypothetical protein
MDFKNLLKHMRGKAAVINGTRYEVGLDGFVHDVKPEDAEKMLVCWKEWEPVGALPPPSVDEDEPEETVDEPNDEPDGPDESMDIDVLKEMADELEVSYGPNIGKALLVERIKEALAKE